MDKDILTLMEKLDPLCATLEGIANITGLEEETYF